MIRILIAAILLLLATSTASAANCTVHVDPLAFGTIDTLGSTAPNTSTTISVNCDSVSPGVQNIIVCGSIGAGSGGESGSLRQMAGSPALKFGLYSSAGTSQPVGSASAPELGSPYRIQVPVSGDTASGTAQLFGLIPTGQGAVAAGTYTADFSTADVDFEYGEDTLDCSAPTGGLDYPTAFTASANVPANCLLQTHDLDFGTHGLIGSEIDAATNMDIICTPGTSYTISIDGGGSGDPDNRLMQSGPDSVRYGLYSNTQRTAVWGTDAGSTVSGTGTGSQDQSVVYGRIPPQDAAPGRYADTVVVTISYE